MIRPPFGLEGRSYHHRGDGGRSDVALRAAILLRGIRSRPASAVMLFAASTVAVAAAAIGPIFLAAADRSVLSTTFASAAPGESAVKIPATGGPPLRIVTSSSLSSPA